MVIRDAVSSREKRQKQTDNGFIWKVDFLLRVGYTSPDAFYF
jgi:hypothetical protein